MPEQLIDAIADAIGTGIPGRGQVRDARRTALGALVGIGNGPAVGVLASLARSAGVRVPGRVGAPAPAPRRWRSPTSRWRRCR